ncbi:MAG TPA: TatD family nuclease-associated radical SAM protein [Thermoleophilia bacterium]|nr:TatD family nuclease-associated radical SAM protein [Thermoleophilia bacterium]
MIDSTRMRSEKRASGSSAALFAAPNFVYWGGPNLYVNLTSRCSASCTFCLASFTDEIYGYDLSLAVGDEPEVPDLVHAFELAFLDGAPEEVVFTGLGEPTLQLDVILGSVEWLGTRRLPTRLDTNGHAALLHPGRDVVRELTDSGLRAASVSLNAHDEFTYDLLCRPTFSKAYRAVLRFIRECVDAGLDVTASVVDLPGVDLGAAASVAADLGAAFRVRRPVLPPDRRREGTT